MKNWITLALCLVLFYSTLSAQSDSSFISLKELSSSFSYDMRYATTNNFLKQKVYSCDECPLRKEVAEALVKANEYFLAQGYRIKLFDCYRPLDVQKQMWEILPDSRYVANPERGSIHNRGGAVDLTLIRLNGEALDMGTDFDHFGEEAHHSYTNLSDIVLQNRTMLKEGLRKFAFNPISTEWWHYNYDTDKSYSVSNFKINCN